VLVEKKLVKLTLLAVKKRERIGPGLVEKKLVKLTLLESSAGREENHKSAKDGRRVLEKAQDKKKKTNLETTQGTSNNSFSLLSDLDILHISKDIGICLGADRKDEKQSILEILEKNRSRKDEFDNSALLTLLAFLGLPRNIKRTCLAGSCCP
jgi:hypothetical protein